MRSTPRHRLLSAALAAAFGTVFVSWNGPALAQTPAQTAAPVFDINVAAQPLAAALNELSRQTGTQILASGEVVSRINAPAVSGRLNFQQALDRLLAGSGLAASREGAAVVIRAAGAAEAGRTLPPVHVTSTLDADTTAAVQREGTAAEGYRVRSATSVGALGNMDLRDAPFAINVVPRELLQNIQAQSPDDVYKVSPSTLSQTPQVSGWAPMVKIRGFSSYDRAEDGLRRSFGFAASLEDKERVEVLNGLSGFLFGAASPGGMVNYVNKRPTLERLNSVTVGNYGGSQYYVHGDFGGQFDSEGRVGYRLNLVRQKGETAVDDQKIDRSLASLALDFKVTDKLKLELGASYSDYHMQAPTAYWSFREGVRRIQAPDSSKNWGQPWIQDETESRKLMAKAIYEANDHLTLRAAYLRDSQERPKQDHTQNSVRSPTEYYQIRIHSGPTKTKSEAWQALADLSFDTGPVGHKLTMGYYGFEDTQWQTSYAPNTGYLGPNGFITPNHVLQPVWPAIPPNSMYYSSRIRNENWVIGDMIRFNDQWSVLVGANRSTIKTLDRNRYGAPNQPDYDRSRTSPNVSLIFKPQPWLTTYATYIEGLEPGGIAPLTASNSMSVMPPMQSKQKEIGAKAELGGVLLSGALFDIEKAYEYTDRNNTYRQDGKQRHRGAEVSASGKLTESWSIVSGVTWLTAKVEGGTYNNNAPMNVPKLLAKLYTEYELPFVPGLSLTGGIYHVGKQWATATNTSRLPSFTTVDLGLRYAIKVSGKPVSLRLTVNNVANRDYWLNSYYLGNPRSVAFSAQMAF